MKRINEFSMNFPAKSNNEGFARSVVGVFASQLDPTVDELADIKTAVSDWDISPFIQQNIHICSFTRIFIYQDTLLYPIAET